MGTYDRRTFIKRSAMVAATVAAVRVLPESVSASPPPNWQDASHPFFTNVRHTPEVIAHRGGNGQWPGETMRALREAAKLKVDVLEMDVFISSDGELVLMHDHEVEVTTEGEGEINELHSDHLLCLNAGHKWSPDGERRPFKDVDVTSPKFMDLKVPRLEEVFDEFPHARMVIEMKKADKSPAAALSAMVKRRGMTNRVLVASFVGKFMTEFRRLSPEVATSFSLSKGDVKRLISGKKISDDDPTDPRAIQLPYKLITTDVVRRAHDRNIKVHAWTVNDLDKMYLMWNRGVDGIITDYPGPLLALLGRAPPA
jgi:glycerophosphoryl diester phosphodiesterase